ncbi:MAG: thioesterase family protein [Porticoccaceae bacterium]|nr:thioesterase family protein [Porticoccaceae bacterium]
MPKGIAFTLFIAILRALKYFSIAQGTKMDFEYYQDLVRQVSTFPIDSAWGQGRSAFGGLTAALVLTHIEKKTGLTDRDLRTINIHFCGAVMLDKPCEFTHRVLSEGKSVFQVEGQLLQDGQVKTQIVACFSAQRQSSIQVTHKPVFAEKSLSETMRFPFVKGMAPDFVQYFDLRITDGNLPASSSKQSRLAGWMRFANPTKSLDDSAMLALIDAWPPAVMPMLDKPAPTSSITWNLEFIQPRDALQANDYLFYECDVIQADFGYAHTQAKIFHPNGQLLALSRQLVGVYDKRG